MVFIRDGIPEQTRSESDTRGSGWRSGQWRARRHREEQARCSRAERTPPSWPEQHCPQAHRGELAGHREGSPERKGVEAPQGWGTDDYEEKKLVKEKRKHRGNFGLLWSQGSQRKGKIKSHQSNSQLVHLPPFEVKEVEVSAGVSFFQVKDSVMFLKLLSHLHPSVFSFFLGF